MVHRTHNRIKNIYLFQNLRPRSSLFFSSHMEYRNILLRTPRHSSQTTANQNKKTQIKNPDDVKRNGVYEKKEYRNGVSITRKEDWNDWREYYNQCFKKKIQLVVSAIYSLKDIPACMQKNSRKLIYLGNSNFKKSQVKKNQNNSRKSILAISHLSRDVKNPRKI